MIAFEDQPLGPVYQIGYICEDLALSMRQQTEALGTGPWFVANSFTMPEQAYRATPTPDLDISVAFSFLGDMMYELIVQNDPGPSVYRDVLDERGYGLHHIARFTRSFDDEAARLDGLGYARAFEVTTGPELGAGRVTYFDARHHFGVMLELCEHRDEVIELFSAIKRECDNWDGTDPIRSLPDLAASLSASGAGA